MLRTSEVRSGSFQSVTGRHTFSPPFQLRIGAHREARTFPVFRPLLAFASFDSTELASPISSYVRRRNGCRPVRTSGKHCVSPGPAPSRCGRGLLQNPRTNRVGTRVSRPRASARSSVHGRSIWGKRVANLPGRGRTRRIVEHHARFVSRAPISRRRAKWRDPISSKAHGP